MAEEEKEEEEGRKLSDPQRVLDGEAEAAAARLQLGSSWAAGRTGVGEKEKDSEQGRW